MTAIAVEAVIEEARRRAKRRRLALAGLVAFLVAGGGIWAGLALTGGSGAPVVTAPPGYHLVQARGPVGHLLAETRTLPSPLGVDVSTGEARLVRTTVETWFDPRGGHLRMVFRVDGRVQSDDVQPCRLPCVPTLASSYWPVDTKQFQREPKTDIFHGRSVIWLTERRRDGVYPDGKRIGLDAVTHDPVVARSLIRGKLISESWILERKPDIAANDFAFVVPDGGFGQYTKISSTADFTATGSKPFALRARKALGRTPLWLGGRFRGHRLQGLVIGTKSLETPDGTRLHPARYVIYDYGIVRLQEFGAKRPTGYEQGPRPGSVVVEKSLAFEASASTSGAQSVRVEALEPTASLSRDGVLVLFSPPLLPPRVHIDRTSAVELAEALRPVPLG
jgi:hypothetical protein